MENIGRLIRDRTQMPCLTHRVALLEKVTGPLVVEDASSIVSRVPYATLERGPYAGRRRRWCVEGAAGTAAFAARAGEVRAGVAHDAVTYVRDGEGQRVVAAVADRSTRTIHLAADLDRATVLQSTVDDPARLIVEAILEPLLAHLVEADGAPHVGAHVAEQLHEVLTLRANTSRFPRYEREVAFLKDADSRGELPRALQRRLAMLEAALRGERKHTVPEGLAAAEVERLVRLVKSRACGALRVGAGEIRGLLNPRAVDDTRGHIALMFSLRPPPIPDGPDLLLWPVGRPQPALDRAMCLGQGTKVFRRLQRNNDAFGLVDCVLNFVETNHLGLVPLAARERVSCATELFELLF